MVSAPVMPTAEGTTLRTAAMEMVIRFPAAAKWLVAYADHVDAEQARTDQQRRTPPPDTRGRWVRRTQRNFGPHLYGIGHVSVVERRSTLDSTETLCGKVLLGRLDWRGDAITSDGAPSGWRDCKACVRVTRALAATATAVSA